MDYQRFDDETLLQLMAQSHTQALSALYDRYSALVFGLAWHILADRAACEEVTQDTFLRVWEKAGSYRPELGRVTAWLSQIARNRAIDRLRHQKARRENGLVGLDEIPNFILSSGHPVEGEVDLREQRERVRWALNQLPPEQCQALALAYFGGLTQEQIAQTLDEPLGTVKTRVRLGMQKLRRLLGEDEPGIR